MGLAGAKNRRKLAKDPNNTRWSRNTDSFGHRMLRSQGWEPGQYLGPQGASHAAFHTAASASHIRVVLKEDNLGLGAKVNRGDECTGLSAFKEMLSRLNGKSEAAIETERRAKEDYQRSLYVERKFGNMRFVSGGFLVGDKIQDSSASPSVDAAESDSSSSQDDVAASSEEAVEDKTAARKEKKSKKRKAEDNAEAADISEEASRSERKHKKRRRDREVSSAGGEENVARSSPSETEADPSATEQSSSRKRSKAEKKEKKKEKKRRREERQSKEDDDLTDSDARRRREKAERKERKREKKRKEGDAGAAKAAEDAGGEESRESAAATPSGSGASTPVGSGTSTPVSHVSARHMARRRFIAQKRMALTDQQAMNQIFMIKSS